MPEVDHYLEQHYTQVQLLGVRVSSLRIPSFNLDDLVRTVMICKAWNFPTVGVSRGSILLIGRVDKSLCRNVTAPSASGAGTHSLQMLSVAGPRKTTRSLTVLGQLIGLHSQPDEIKERL